jgi:ankyrin repeat protein
VELGGRVNDCDQDGCTALHYAAGHGHIDAAAALLAAGALVSVADKRGCLALDYAVQHNETEMVIMLQSTTGAGQ